MKRITLFIAAALIALTATLPAQLFVRNNVQYLSGWIDASTAPITTVGTDSAFYVHMGSLPSNSYILGAEFYTHDAWSNNAPADSACIGTSDDLDLIVNETSCETVGNHSSSVLAAATIYSLTDAQDIGPVYGYKRITSDGTPRSSGGKIWFVLWYVRGVSEPGD